MISFCIDASALTIVVIGFLQTISNLFIPKWLKAWFLTLFSVLAVYVSSNSLTWVLYEFTDHTLATQISMFIESLFSAAALPVLTILLLRSCGEDYRRRPLFYIVLSLFALYCVVLVITQFTKLFYYFTPGNVYHRGPYYFVLLGLPMLIMLVNLIGLLIKHQRLEWIEFIAFLVYILAPTASMILQLLFYGVNTIVLGSAIGAIFLMAVTQRYQTRQYLRQKEKITEQRATIAVLQMRPHFIYNTMTSIYFLCDSDPQKAQQVTLDFTTYLRKIFDSIAKESTIPFDEELEHTRAYLAVEQVRFEGKLNVIFDTPYTDFELPPLTLQPIVENAVKYGVDPDLRPLMIKIMTRKTKKHYEVIVEDTGPGVKEGDNGNPHIALSNIIERLDMMCGGTLTISDRKKGGMIVKMTIPVKSKQPNSTAVISPKKKQKSAGDKEELPA